MDKVYIVYIFDEEEDTYTVDSVYVIKEIAEAYADRHNKVNKSFNHLQRFLVQEMEISDT